MQSIDVRIVLAIIVLIAIAVYLSNLEFYAYSNKEIVDQCLVVQDRYEELISRSASDSEWQEFERASQETLAPIAEDLENTGRSSQDRYLLRQLVVYNVPRWVKSRGKGEAASKAFTILGVRLPELSITRKQRELARQRRRGMTARGTDPLVVCMVIFDGLLAAGVAYLLWPKGKTSKTVDPKTMSRRLDVLDKKIEKSTNAAIYRGTRARLRAEMGLREEAIEDIDWLMKRKPHGVDLLALYELRESLIEEIETSDKNVDE